VPELVQPPFPVADADAIARDLEHVLALQLDERVRVREVVPFGDGHSGFTYALDAVHGDEVERCVLRLSPPGARIAGSADVGRQGRIMAALGAAGLPAPRILAGASEPCVAGRAFALMERIEAESWEQAAARSSHRALAARAVALLTQVRAVPAERTGLAGEPAVTPQAELARWGGLIERTPLHAAARPLADALQRSAPPPTPVPSLVHGDFHYGNLLFRDGEIVALLDWEIAALGDPLGDLGCLAVAALRQRYRPDPNPIGFGLPLAELLALADGDLKAARWWIAASCFKYAAILAYNRELHRRGRRIDPVYEHFERTLTGLLADGAALLADGATAF
jgi:aminoglycoside phosphotransferase (APT) family kinase protein